MNVLIPQAGAKIRDARERAGLTQLDVCKQTGVSIWTISNIERGKNLEPSRRVLLPVLDLIGLTEDDVLERVAS